MQACRSDRGLQISGVPARLKILLAVLIDERHSRSTRLTATGAQLNEPNHFQTRRLKLLIHPGFASKPHSSARKGRNSKTVHWDFAPATRVEFASLGASRCA